MKRFLQGLKRAVSKKESHSSIDLSHHAFIDTTPDQESRIPDVREKWTAISRSTEPVQVEAIKAASQKLFPALGFVRPEDFRFYSSPSAALDDLESWKQAVDPFSDRSWEADFSWGTDRSFLPIEGPKGTINPAILHWIENQMGKEEVEWFEPWERDHDAQLDWLEARFEAEHGPDRVSATTFEYWALTPDDLKRVAAAADFFRTVADVPLDPELTDALAELAKSAGLLFTFGRLMLVIDRPSGFEETDDPKLGPIPVYQR